MSDPGPILGGLAVQPNAVAPASSPQELQGFRSWGRWATGAVLPNAAGNAAAALSFDTMRPGDIAFVEATLSLHVLVNQGTVGGADAVWGSVLVNGQLLLPDGTLGAPTYSYAAEPNTGQRRTAAGQIGWDILGTSRLTLGATEMQVNATIRPFTSGGFNLGLFNRQWGNLFSIATAIGSSPVANTITREVDTSDATPTVLWVDTDSIDRDYTIWVSAAETTLLSRANFRQFGKRFTRYTNFEATVLELSTDIQADAGTGGSAAWTAVVQLDGSDDTEILVTGALNVDIRWRAWITYWNNRT